MLFTLAYQSQKLQRGEAIPDYIAQHDNAFQVHELFIAEVLFIVIAHHPRLQPRTQASTQLPLRLIVCKLHTPEERLCYPGSRVWDIDLRKKPHQPHYDAFGVEAALLREVLACRVLEYNDNRRLHDVTTIQRRKRDVDGARKSSIRSTLEGAPEKQVLLDDAATIRLIRVHHQSMISKKLS